MTPGRLTPNAWAGDRCFILGGGPSLAAFDVERLRGHGRVIAVNDAGLYLAPWADMLFWADARWLEWNYAKLGLHTGALKVTRRRPHITVPHEIITVEHRPNTLSHDVGFVGGMCGGSAAINLAYLLGCPRIILLGFDMRPGNWHENHKITSYPGQHANKFIPALEIMAPLLEKAGVMVLNSYSQSALRYFPSVDIDAELYGNDHDRR